MVVVITNVVGAVDPVTFGTILPSVGVGVGIGDGVEPDETPIVGPEQATTTNRTEMKRTGIRYRQPVPIHHKTP